MTNELLETLSRYVEANAKYREDTRPAEDDLESFERRVRVVALLQSLKAHGVPEAFAAEVAKTANDCYYRSSTQALLENHVRRNGR
jgi:hypothetical protein